jgi:glyceraldehyde-3-phosphate dehydrogenase type I
MRTLSIVKREGNQMKKLKVGINGLGRIGRSLVRESFRRNAQSSTPLNFEIVAVNNPGSIDTYIHLLKYDSIHRHFNLDISERTENSFMVNGQKINFYTQKDPSEIPWDENQVNIVADSTGIFKDNSTLSKHLGGSVKKVILCAPGEVDGTFVFGINHKEFNPETQHIVSNASCTTNCLAPVAKVLNDNFKIINGFMTTVHAYTSDQNLLDNSHSDLRRARAAALSMIPTTTGAAKATSLVIPELKGKLDGYAIRVPTADVSMVDLTVNFEKTATIQQINDALKKESLGSLKSVLGYTEEPLVSVDFMGATESSIVDAAMTNVIGNTAKVVAWYDNEIGFSNRVLDLADYIGSKTWA